MIQLVQRLHDDVFQTNGTVGDHLLGVDFTQGAVFDDICAHILPEPRIEYQHNVADDVLTTLETDDIGMTQQRSQTPYLCSEYTCTGWLVVAGCSVLVLFNFLDNYQTIITYGSST